MESSFDKTKYEGRKFEYNVQNAMPVYSSRNYSLIDRQNYIQNYRG